MDPNNPYSRPDPRRPLTPARRDMAVPQRTPLSTDGFVPARPFVQPEQPVPQPQPQPTRPVAPVAPASDPLTLPSQPPVVQAAPTPPPQQPLTSQSIESAADNPNTPPPPPEPPKEPSKLPKKLLKTFGWFAGFVVSVVVGAAVINTFIFQSYYVQGESMTPTLQNQDRLIIDKVERTWSMVKRESYIPKRGQIVVLDSALVGSAGSHDQLIKRVIGLPGDAISFEGGKVIVRNSENPNGFNVDEQLGLKLDPTSSSSAEATVVPENHIYVLGDNRAPNGSYDSRMMGPVQADKIEGRLWLRVLPIDKSGVF